jgi:hypothetical protein
MRCGLNQATAEYVIEAQGYDSTEELVMVSQDHSYDTMVRNAIESAPPDVTFLAASIRRLNAFKYWAVERFMCGLVIFPQTFTAEIFREYLLLVRADEIEVAAKKGQVPTKPDTLNLEKD